jgi:hypothetical protein
MTVLADGSSWRPERTWSERRLGLDCKVLKHSSCQSIYGCCSVCVPASKLSRYKNIMHLNNIIFENLLKSTNCIFPQMAGFALFRKYKSQFLKMLSIISNNFLEALKAREEPGLSATIFKIQSYLEDRRFLKEPEGWGLQGSLLSNVMVPEQESYYRQPPARNSYY